MIERLSAEELTYFAEHRYDERMHDALVNPAGISSILANNILRKTFNASAFIVGNNALATAAGGALRIDSLVFRITTTFASGGAPTLDLQNNGVSMLAAPFALATLVGPRTIARTAGGTTLAVVAAAGAVVEDGSLATTSAFLGGGINSSDFTSTCLQAVVAAATYTAGVLEMDVVWAPLTSGATLT